MPTAEEKAAIEKEEKKKMEKKKAKRRGRPSKGLGLSEHYINDLKAQLVETNRSWPISEKAIRPNPSSGDQFASP